MGDVVFTLPAVNLVRENFPDARITFLTAAENRAIVEQFDAVDEVLSLDRQLFKQHHYGKGCAMLYELMKKLRSSNFCLSIDLQSYGETALLTRLTGAKDRWAWVIGNKLRKHAYTHVTARSDQLHPVDINLEMLTQFGLKTAPVRNEIQLSNQGRDEAYQFFKDHGLNLNLPTFVIQAFTSAAHKNWPLENYLTVAKRWRNSGYQIVFSGGPKEAHCLEPATRAGFPVCISPIATVCWLMKLSRLVIGGDTGLLHLGVAIGKRVVVLMSPDGARTPIPYGHVKWVVWTPTDKDIRGISIDSVNRAIEKALIPGEYDVFQGMPVSQTAFA
jgi:ADP-heptose:LPS heptosyltransferase